MKKIHIYIKEIFLEPTEKTGLQLLRYTFVGGTAFVVDFTTLFILTDLFHIHYLTSGALSFVCGFLTNFLLANELVFKNQRPENIYKEIGGVLAISLTGLGLNEILLWFITGFLGAHYLLSKAVSAIIIYGFNFFGRKLFIYKK